VELFLLGNSLAGCSHMLAHKRPVPVVIEIAPGAAHSGAHTLYLSFMRDYGEGSVAIVAI